MKQLKIIIIFLVINFGALAVGAWLMGDGPKTTWYQNLNKAAWTPPGWAFGVAWTFIMICFSIYMGLLYTHLKNSKVLILFTIQFVLNVIWNYIFFNQMLTGLALLLIMGLTAIITIFLYDFRNIMKWKSVLILPYLLWLCIATSLNMYIVIHN